MQLLKLNDKRFKSQSRNRTNRDSEREKVSVFEQRAALNIKNTVSQKDHINENADHFFSVVSPSPSMTILMQAVFLRYKILHSTLIHKEQFQLGQNIVLQYVTIPVYQYFPYF